MAEIQRLRMFAGPNGSGKSSLYAKMIKEGHFRPTTFINADDIQESLSSGNTLQFSLQPGTGFFKALEQSPFLSKGLTLKEVSSLEGDPSVGLTLKKGALCGPYLAAAVADALRTVFLDQQRSFAFETVMSHDSKLDLLKQAQQLGYRVYMYFVTTGDPGINQSRVRQRVEEGGHFVPSEKVVDRFRKTMAILPRALLLCDRAYLFDNSGKEHRLVGIVSGGQNLHLVSTGIPLWVQDLLPVAGDEI